MRFYAYVILLFVHTIVIFSHPFHGKFNDVSASFNTIKHIKHTMFFFSSLFITKQEEQVMLFYCEWINYVCRMCSIEAKSMQQKYIYLIARDLFFL